MCAAKQQMTYFRIPKMAEPNTCPCCDRPIITSQKQKVVLYSFHKDDLIYINTELPHCQSCGISSIDDTTLNRIKTKSRRYSPEIFEPLIEISAPMQFWRDFKKMPREQVVQLIGKTAFNEELYHKKRLRKSNRAEQIRELFKSNTEYSLLFLLSTDDYKLHTLIISNSNEQPAPDIDVRSYKDADIRSMLVKVLRNGEKTITLRNVKYRIIERNTEKDSYVLSSITLRKKGGYKNELPNGKCTVVDALLFSPFNCRYEIVQVTHDPLHTVVYSDYYLDPLRYRRFCRENGNPELDLGYSFSRSGRKNSAFENLQEESIPHMFGYNVDRNENLSANERQEILSDLVDLNIMSKYSIVNLLEFLIDNHPGSIHEEAREKWEEDIKFISNYNEDPKRFIIAIDKQSK